MMRLTAEWALAKTKIWGETCFQKSNAINQCPITHPTQGQQMPADYTLDIRTLAACSTWN